MLIDQGKGKIVQTVGFGSSPPGPTNTQNLKIATDKKTFKQTALRKRFLSNY